jgi:hypothetical protein
VRGRKKVKIKEGNKIFEKPPSPPVRNTKGEGLTDYPDARSEKQTAQATAMQGVPHRW